MAQKKKQTKMKTFTNVVVIDASGSMSSKTDAVRDGLRELFKDIRDKASVDKETVFKTIVVDFSAANDINVLVNDVNTGLLTDELANSYNTRGSTALYDAIGYAFSLVEAKDDNVVFVNILTDGQENASQKVTHEMVKTLIAESRKAGWGITFMGVSEEAIDSAVNLGISRGNTIMYANSVSGTMAASAARGKMSDALYGSGRFGYSINTDTLADDLTTDDDKKKEKTEKK